MQPPLPLAVLLVWLLVLTGICNALPRHEIRSDSQAQLHELKLDHPQGKAALAACSPLGQDTRLRSSTVPWGSIVNATVCAFAAIVILIGFPFLQAIPLYNALLAEMWDFYSPG